MSDWQPIETAPKDRTEFIGFDGVGVFCYSWQAEPDDDDHTGWCIACYSFGGVLYDLHSVPGRAPTHWMPLPAPPVATEA